MEEIDKRQYFNLKLFYFLLFSGVGCFWPYITLFYKRIHFSGAEIGFLTAIGPTVLLFTQPVWGIISDKTKSPHLMLSVACFMAIIVSLLFLLPNQFLLFLILMGLFAIFGFPMISLADTLTLGYARKHSISYGQVRVWGSIGFSVIVVIVGQLAVIPSLGNFYHWLHPNLSLEIIQELRGLPLIFIAYALVLICALWVSFRLPQYPVQISVSPRGGVLLLLKNKRFAVFLFAVFLLQATATSTFTYFSIYIDHLNGQTGLLGWAMTIAAAYEAPVFLFAAKIFRRFNSLTLLTAAGIIGCLRWYIFTLITNPVQVLWLQPTHAINFGCYYLGAIHFVDEETPAEWKTTGQTIFGAVGYGLAAIIGNIMGGIIYNQWGVVALYRTGAIIALTAAFIFFFIEKFIPRKPTNPV